MLAASWALFTGSLPAFAYVPVVLFLLDGDRVTDEARRRFGCLLAAAIPGLNDSLAL